MVLISSVLRSHFSSAVQTRVRPLHHIPLVPSRYNPTLVPKLESHVNEQVGIGHYHACLFLYSQQRHADDA